MKEGKGQTAPSNQAPNEKGGDNVLDVSPEKAGSEQGLNKITAQVPIPTGSQNEEENDEFNNSFISDGSIFAGTGTRNLELERTALISLRKKGSKKRKLEPLSPVLDDHMQVFLEQVTRLCDETKGLSILVDKNGDKQGEDKDKQELKDKVRYMLKLTNKVIKSKDRLSFHMPDSHDSDSDLESVRSEQEKMEIESTVEHKIQEMICERCKKEIIDEKMVLEQIITTVDEIGGQLVDADKLKEVVTRNWPEKAFRKVEAVEGLLKEQAGEINKIIIIQKEEAARLSNKRNWVDDITGHTGILKELVNLNQPIMCEKQNSFKVLGNLQNGGQAQTKSFIMITDVNQEENMINMYKGILLMLDNSDKNEICATLTGSTESNMLRMFLEIAATKIEKQVKLIQPSYAKRTNDTEALLVKKGEGTYADMARKIRQGIVPETLGVSIKSFKESKEGDVLIVTNKGESQTLKSAIENKFTGSMVETRFGIEVLTVLDLDSSCTESEIIEAVASAINKPVNAVKLRSLRPSKLGVSIATVTVPAPDADMLIKLGAVKVGWVWCRVKPKITIDRCLNCLELGHTTSRCSKPREVNKKCFNCTKSGHLASECTNDKYCIKCKVQGHRNDSFACPEYKAWVSQNQ